MLLLLLKGYIKNRLYYFASIAVSPLAPSWWMCDTDNVTDSCLNPSDSFASESPLETYLVGQQSKSLYVLDTPPVALK